MVGTKEQYSFRVTVPEFQFEDGPPASVRQKAAVLDFFGVSCEFKQQASLMLSARNQGYLVADSLSAAGVARDFLAFAVASHILSNKSLRSAAAIWNQRSNKGRREPEPDKMSEGLRFQPQIFARKLRDDLCENGSQIQI